MDVFFKDHQHQERFKAAVAKYMAGGEDSYLMSLLYTVSSDEALWNAFRGPEAPLDRQRLRKDHRILTDLALTLDAGNDFSLTDLDECLDDDNYRVALEALWVRRVGAQSLEPA